jgi:hypothetical protein
MLLSYRSEQKIRFGQSREGGQWILLTLIALFFAMSSASASKISVGPNFGMQSEYNDNINFEANDTEAVLGSIVRGNLNLKASTQRSMMALDPGFRIVRYNRLQSLNNNHYKLDAKSKYDWVRLQMTADGGRLKSDTLTQENEGFGSSQVRKPLLRTFFNPGLTYELSERAVVYLSYNQSETKYQDAKFTRLFDYNSATWNLGLNFIHNSRFSSSLNILQQDYKVDRVESATTSRSFYYQTNMNVTETTDLKIILGKRETDITYPLANFSYSKAGSELSMEITQRSRLSEWSFTASQSATEGSIGSLLERNELRMGFKRSINQRTHGGMRAGAVANKAIDPTRNNLDEQYGRATVYLDYRLRKNVTLSFTAEKYFRRTDLQTQLIQANTIRAGITIIPHQIDLGG